MESRISRLVMEVGGISQRPIRDFVLGEHVFGVSFVGSPAYYCCAYRADNHARTRYEWEASDIFITLSRLKKSP